MHKSYVQYWHTITAIVFTYTPDSTQLPYYTLTTYQFSHFSSTNVQTLRRHRVGVTVETILLNKNHFQHHYRPHHKYFNLYCTMHSPFAELTEFTIHCTLQDKSNGFPGHPYNLSLYSAQNFFSLFSFDRLPSFVFADPRLDIWGSLESRKIYVRITLFPPFRWKPVVKQFPCFSMSFNFITTPNHCTP